MKKLLFILALICFFGCDSEKDKKQTEVTAQEAQIIAEAEAEEKLNFQNLPPAPTSTPVDTTTSPNPNPTPTPTNNIANPSIPTESPHQSANFVSVCDRTPQVRDEIVLKILMYRDEWITCDQVTEAHLKAITSFFPTLKRISSLKSYDFMGLTSLRVINLSGHHLSSFPEGFFSSLTDLRVLKISRNKFRSLSEGLLSGLINLQTLDLGYNDLSSLPGGFLSGVINLQTLDLRSNNLSSLSEGFLSGVINLQDA